MVTRWDLLYRISIHAITQGLGNISDEALTDFMDNGGMFFRGKLTQGDYIHIPGGWIVGHRASGNTLSIGIRNGTVSQCNSSSHSELIQDYEKSKGMIEMKAFLRKIMTVITGEIGANLPIPAPSASQVVPTLASPAIQAQAAPAPTPNPTQTRSERGDPCLKTIML